MMDKLEVENESLKIKIDDLKSTIEDQKYTIDNLRKTVLDFQERYSGALKRIDELEEENHKSSLEYMEVLDGWERLYKENKNLIAALKKADEMILNKQWEESPEYQAVKHLLEDWLTAAPW